MKHSMAVPILALALLICFSRPAGAQSAAASPANGAPPADVVTLARVSRK